MSTCLRKSQIMVFVIESQKRRFRLFCPITIFILSLMLQLYFVLITDGFRFYRDQVNAVSQSRKVE